MQKINSNDYNPKLIGERLREARTSSGYSIRDLARLIGISHPTISRYENGMIDNMNVGTLKLIADALNVSSSWIVGLTEEKNFTNKPNQFNTTSIPIIGTIAAGTPILADENIESRFNLDASIHADFGLKIRGDSMIEAGIYDGDIVFIRQQPDVENGEIAAVLIDDSATLKKVYKNNGTLILQAANQKYQPMIFHSGEIRILGKLAAILNIKN